MKLRQVARVALMGTFFWILAAGKTIPKNCVNLTASVALERLAQNTDTQTTEFETQAAEEVRQRHLADMLKIPHVVNLGIEFRNSKIIFNAQVDKEANVPEVESMVPTKIEGYDVAVEAVATGVLY